MRFLLFNIVVAGALIFLFTGDKADLHAAADRAHDAATDIKAKAFKVIGAKKAPAVTEAPKAVVDAAPAKPIATKTITAEPGVPANTTSASRPEPGTAAAEAVKEVQVATRRLVKPLPPEVKKRREEVLSEGIVGGKSRVSTAPAGSDTQKFMTSSDRKRDLMLLSEEMELFSAKSIAR